MHQTYLASCHLSAHRPSLGRGLLRNDVEQQVRSNDGGGKLVCYTMQPKRGRTLQPFAIHLVGAKYLRHGVVRTSE